MNGRNFCDDPVDDTIIEIETDDSDVIVLDRGVKGDPGQSAYQVWLSLGNHGTKQDFIKSLRGTPQVFMFEDPQLVWVINHNYGYYPQVTVYSVGGMEVDANVVNVSINQVQVVFNTPYAGSAQLL